MNVRICISVATIAITLSFSTTPSMAQTSPSSATWSQQDALRIGNELQKRLGRLVNYGVFDWITFGDHGRTVVLRGFASRPTLKSEAENAVKTIPGVDSVENQIEVLPNSPNDDRVRATVYNRIYTQPSLRRYNANAGYLARAVGPGRPGVALLAGGITNQPPIGYHAIHIIVKNGNVILYGVVLNENDVSMAGMQANSAPGAFSIDNNLIAERSTAKGSSK